MGPFMLVSQLLLVAFVAASSTSFKRANVTDTYDYVVVGGGTSGLVVANRLSEDPTKTVFVINHGYIDTGPNTTIPHAAYSVPISETWDVVSEPIEHLGNATFGVTVASVVGGGSVINGMFADRGSKADYDAWEALGNPGWGWDGLLPYFRKSTNFTPPLPDHVKDYGYKYDASMYGNGPLQVGYPSTQFPDFINMTTALQAYGVEISESPEGGDALGFVFAPSTLNFATGTRCHSRAAYYDPVAQRPNLHLITGQTVTEILFDDNLTATGVQFVSRQDNSTQNVYATQEVILAAGAIMTPKLLQNSGIGPASVLEAAGVDVKHDLPSVGANFQDHPVMYLAWNLTNFQFPTLSALDTNTTYNASAWEEYVVNHTGPYTIARGNSAVFLPLSQITPNDSAIIEELASQHPLDYLPAVYQQDPTLLDGFKAQRDILIDHFSGTNAAVAEFPAGAAGIGAAVVEKPLSRGTVTLDPTNPKGGPPVVCYNTLANPVDRKILVDGMRFVRGFYEDPLLAGYMPVELAPGEQYQTDDQILAAALAAGLIQPSFAHPSGTCAMMPENMGGCIASDLRVYGAEKLSVVDASIMPLIPATHLQTTVYAVAEKAADIIKARSV